jgi:hypothetical protein
VADPPLRGLLLLRQLYLLPIGTVCAVGPIADGALMTAPLELLQLLLTARTLQRLVVAHYL